MQEKSIIRIDCKGQQLDANTFALLITKACQMVANGTTKSQINNKGIFGSICVASDKNDGAKDFKFFAVEAVLFFSDGSEVKVSFYLPEEAKYFDPVLETFDGQSQEKDLSACAKNN